MQLKLRRYQREALDKIDEQLAAGVLRTAVVLPTGMGKTVVFAEFIRRAHSHGRRAVVLVHRDELAEQAKTKIHSVAPEASIGIVKAERNEVDADVIVASVQTLARQARRDAIDPETVDVVIVDECHHAAARTWADTLTYFGCFSPADEDPLPWCDCRPGERCAGPCRQVSPTPAIGFTATLYREDGKLLAGTHEDAIWQTVAYERPILYGVENGHLVDVRGQMVDVKGLDLADVRRSRGDYQDGDLGRALIESNAGHYVAQAYAEHAGDRRGVLFAPTVESAIHFSEWLNAEGIVTEVITGTTSKEDRTLIYKRYDAGEVQVLANCMVLTEGWDSPATSCAVIARPTQNPALYTQMVGRVLRTFPGKEDALVLDVTGISASHKLQSLTKLTNASPKPGESIREAIEREAREAGELAERRKVHGSTAQRTVDLFASSKSVWLQTYGGTWFIPVRGGAPGYVLWQNTDLTWRVGRKMKREKGEWLAQGLTQEYAMAWGEQLAAEEDPTVSRRNRSWRRSKPSDAQVELALRMKLLSPEDVEEIRRGELSDLLSVFFASKDLGERRPVGVSR